MQKSLLSLREFYSEDNKKLLIIRFKNFATVLKKFLIELLLIFCFPLNKILLINNNSIKKFFKTVAKFLKNIKVELFCYFCPYKELNLFFF